VTTVAAAIIAAPSSASALERIDLLVQAVQFLFGNLAFAFGFLKGRDDAFEIAQDRFQAVANAINLSAQGAIGRTLPIIAAPAAISASFATIIAALVATVASAPPVASVIASAFRFALAILGMFAVGFGALFVKLVCFVRFAGRFRRALAFGRFVHGGRNVLVFVTRAIFAFYVALAKIVVFASARFLALG
jgi:hypothetical protein